MAEKILKVGITPAVEEKLVRLVGAPLEDLERTAKFVRRVLGFYDECIELEARGGRIVFEHVTGAKEVVRLSKNRVVAIEVGAAGLIQQVQLADTDVPNVIEDADPGMMGAGYKTDVDGILAGFVRVQVQGLWRASVSRFIADRIEVLGGSC